MSRCNLTTLSLIFLSTFRSLTCGSIYVMFDVKARFIIRFLEFTLFNQIIFLLFKRKHENLRANSGEMFFKITSQQTRKNAFLGGDPRRNEIYEKRKCHDVIMTSFNIHQIGMSGCKVSRVARIPSNLPRQTWKCFRVFFRGARA